MRNLIKIPRGFVSFLALCSIIGGLILLLNAILPLLHYELIAAIRFQRQEFLSPVPPVYFGGQVSGIKSEVYPLNLIQPQNWFEGSVELPQVESKIEYYNISIPRLKIKDAVVQIGGTDLTKNLIHYKGTAIPGTEGNAVVFGHSSLPQFFSPSNYLSIFAKLPTLQAGDDIIVNYDGITYKFKVQEMFEVKPTDIQVLAQRYDNSYLTLVTCVPPGTYLRRLVVIAKLIPPEYNNYGL